MTAPHSRFVRVLRVAELVLLALATTVTACDDSSDLGHCARDAGSVAVTDAGTCNGSASLCERRYDQVVYVTAHNAMANADEGWHQPNQQHGIGRALADGVRGLMLDVHDYRGEAYLCHALCTIGRRPLDDALCELRQFLEQNPGEIVTLLYEDHVVPAMVLGAAERAGLMPYVYAHRAGEMWPTLGEMVASGRRVVMFAEEHGEVSGSYLDLYAHAGETRYSFRTPGEMDCMPNRGSVSHPLFILNHFLTRQGGSAALSRQVNFNPLLEMRALRCMQETGRLPNFLAVDFYDIGDVFALARGLNGT